jgi:hypothetical protein
VITSEKEKVFRILDFIGKHEGDAFNGLFSAVDIVAEKEVVLVAGVTAVLEKFYKV